MQKQITKPSSIYDGKISDLIDKAIPFPQIQRSLGVSFEQVLNISNLKQKANETITPPPKENINPAAPKRKRKTGVSPKLTTIKGV